MTNTKITRTINVATIRYTYADMNAKTVESNAVNMATTQKVTDKQAERFVKSMLSNVGVLLSVDSITYESRLYEMDLQTFIEHAKYIGDGRVTLE